jgi:hypothetical protein
MLPPSSGGFSPDFTLVSCVAYSQTLKKERRVTPKRRLNFNGLCSIIFQKTELFLLKNMYVNFLVASFEKLAAPAFENRSWLLHRIPRKHAHNSLS